MSAEEVAIARTLPEVQRVAEIQARMALAREETRRALAALRIEIERDTDWHTWYQARPGLFLATAFVVGFLLGRSR